MTMTSAVESCIGREGRSRCARGAVAWLLLTGGAVASAQAIGPATPYEAGQRLSVGSELGQSSLPQGGVFEPRIEAAVQYAANVSLAEDGEPQIDMAGAEVAPGFYTSLSTDAFQGSMDYSLIARAWEESDFNDVSHLLSANGQWLAVPDWFALLGSTSYQDGIIDPRSGLNYGGLGIFGSSNLQEVATASVNPTLRHRFNLIEVAADYRYGRVWYFDQGKGGDPVNTEFSEDSTDQSARVSVGTAETGARAHATVFYDWQRSEYESSFVPYEFERAGVNADVQVSGTLSVVGDAGVETDLGERVAQGGLDSSFWSIGLRWTPNENTSAEVRVGDRSFGTSYFLSVQHRARLLEFDASYDEQPTVETQRLSLGDIFPGELPPGVPDVDVGIVNNLPFLARNGRIGVTAQGSRTSLGVSGFWYERDYLLSRDSDESGYGASVRATRQLASNLSADFDVGYREYERSSVVGPVTESRDRDTEATFRVNRTTSDKLTLSGEAGYLIRSGDLDYDGWWIAMRARYSP